MSKSRASTPAVPTPPNPGTARRSSRQVTSDRPVHPSMGTRARPAASSDPETRRRRSAHHRVTSPSPTGKPNPRSASAERGDSHSSSSESPGEMADTETGEVKDATVEVSSPTKPEPVKKKRTRTLTTPHQSAVLHALLAQSRFPSTAQREEVGRSIGLSARKVQIWFQNQRQKARRPKNPNTASSSSAVSGPHAATTSATTLPPTSYTLGAAPVPLLPQSFVLSGPGVPGLDPSYAHTSSIGRSHDVSGVGPTRTSSPSPRIQPYSISLERPRSTSPPLLYRSHALAMRSPRAPEPSRTLPPLIPPSLSYRGVGGAPIPRRQDSRSSLPTLHSVVEGAHGEQSTPQTSPTEPIFAHNPEGPPIRPFTLQPPVRWETESYVSTFYPRPPSSWTDLSSYRPSPPSTANREEETEQPDIPARDEEQHEERSSSSLRSGRYDPVRGIVVPYSAPSSSPPPNIQDD